MPIGHTVATEEVFSGTVVDKPCSRHAPPTFGAQPAGLQCGGAWRPLTVLLTQNLPARNGVSRKAICWLDGFPSAGPRTSDLVNDVRGKGMLTSD